MNYLLDTNILIEIENDNLKIIKELEQIKLAGTGKLFISIFSFSEFFYGIVRKNLKNKEKILERLKEYELINTTKESGILFCEILSKLKDAGKMVPQFDAFIAALAIENDLTLITRDEHFKEIPTLKMILLKVDI